MNHLISCTCGQAIVKSIDGKTKILSKVLILSEDGQAVAVCKSCDKEVAVPLNLNEDMLKSMSKPRHVPLYVRDARKSS